jgi:hypothetical protein
MLLDRSADLAEDQRLESMNCSALHQRPNSFKPFV